MVRGRSNGHYWGVVLDAPDVRALGMFYAELLGWEVYRDEPNEVTLAAPEGNAYLAVQQDLARNPGPSGPGGIAS